MIENLYENHIIRQEHKELIALKATIKELLRQRKVCQTEVLQLRGDYAALKKWAREALKGIVPKGEWPDCGKPYWYCQGCGAEAKLRSEIKHFPNCLYTHAKDLGLEE